MINYIKMTPAFQKWCSSLPPEQCNLLDYASYYARVDQMIFYLDLFWPDFVEKEGLILRRNGIPEDWNSFKKQFQSENWSSQNIEYVINHIHITDIFLNDPDRDVIDKEAYIFLADTIASIWKCRLESLFPDRNFEIGVADRDVSPEVYAFQSNRV